MSRFLHSVLVLLTFALALAAGAWFSIKQRASAFSAGVDHRLAAAASGTLSTVSKAQRAYASDEDMLTAIMSSLSEDEPLLRAHRLHETLGKISSAELAVLFEKAVKLDDRDRREVLLGVLLRRWSDVDPEAAGAAIRPYQDRFRARSHNDGRSLETAVCWAWAGALPERALAEAMVAPDARWAQDIARAAIGSLAEGDPLRQLEVLTRLPESRLRSEMCETAIKALAEKDSAAAEAHLDLLAEPRQRARVQAEILGKLAGRDPAAGLARLAELAPALTAATNGIRLVSSVLFAAGRKDPSAALSAIDGLPQELQSHALNSALVGWADQHPIDALTWAAANDVVLSEAKTFSFFGDYGGAGWNSVFGVALRSDRTKALAWIRTLPASHERDSMLREGIWNGSNDAIEEKFQIYADLTPQGKIEAAWYLVQSSFRSDEGSIETWVKTQPPGAARTAAIQALAALQAGNSPERIDAQAKDWPSQADRDAALRGIASSLSSNDPRRALDFARRVSAPEARQSTFASIAQNWLYRDEPAARAWIISAPEISAEERRVLLRQYDER